MSKAHEALKLWLSVAPKVKADAETAKVIEIAVRMSREALKEAA